MKNIKNNIQALGSAFLIGSSIYLTLSFTSNLLQNINNNFIKPYFDRWGKHKTFLSKLKFEYIKKFNLSNIAGYTNLKNTLIEIVNELKEAKINPKKIEGLCLYGSPGNGKTQIIKALAGQAEVKLLIVNLNTLLNENGHIEENINLLFQEARKNQPCIILFDEFDLITGSRKNGKLSDSEKAILNEFLQQLDGAFPLEGVLVVANTNIINNIDPALQRPGRFGRTIEVSAPNNEDMEAIIALYLKENKIKYDRKFIHIMIEKLNTFNIINVAMIKNYINKINKYLSKNKIKKITEEQYEDIINKLII